MTDSADSLGRNPGRRAADAVRAPTAKVRPTARYVVAAAFEKNAAVLRHVHNWSGLSVVDARRPLTRPQRIRVVPGESLGDFVLGMCLNDAMALLCGYRRTPAAASPTVQWPLALLPSAPTPLTPAGSPGYADWGTVELIYDPQVRSRGCVSC